ncbi:TadA family conjugal transfer-associated ATPase [Demequina sp. TTPB684]|uniref:TadA family conjugal transfer-associated ATPase n=1 Tax=unclassified Demequina TaxID=2620311 RepID=UPI001CF5B747|nr:MULTISPECIES: TadA family conjugal transfer-associated ATPase [unclassified Demequina]MCB2412834.1 TadA family conjugal transfer-associated ATPase [Demequina sp. TTPB684]UPU87535.1 TadA family conjugal transfer-associated ATPase [Demequina sp. TMPB413]
MTTLEWVPDWLRHILEVPGITDVLINTPRDVWIDRGLGLERADEVVPGALPEWEAADVRALAVRFASLGGRRLDDASPAVDARLPDGTRLHAVLPPIADGCAVLSLRTVRPSSLAWEDLVMSGMLHPGLAPVVRGLVRSKRSLVVSGATGSGKTTLLASCLAQVDPAERIVLIEEAGEIRADHPHVVRLVERAANVDGAGEVALARLVREALRMRPDRIVLGECRGAEIRDVLLALNTGHRGSLTTLHANAAQDVPARLVGLGALADLSERAVALHAAAAFTAVVHLEQFEGRRRVAEVALLDATGGRLRTVSAASVDAEGRLVLREAWPLLAAAAGVDERADAARETQLDGGVGSGLGRRGSPLLDAA